MFIVADLVSLNFKISGQRGYFWPLDEAEILFKRLFGH